MSTRKHATRSTGLSLLSPPTRSPSKSRSPTPRKTRKIAPTTKGKIKLYQDSADYIGAVVVATWGTDNTNFAVSSVNSGVLRQGYILTHADIPANTKIVSCPSGVCGGTGTYTLSDQPSTGGTSQTVAATSTTHARAM